MVTNDLMYDWNQVSPPSLVPGQNIYLNDETLRGGLQSPSVSDPPIEMKIELLHAMEERVSRVYEYAKKSSSALDEDQVMRLLHSEAVART